MKLFVEFNLTPRDNNPDVEELCVDIRDRIGGYLMSRQLSWDKVRVGELHTHAISDLYDEMIMAEHEKQR